MPVDTKRRRVFLVSKKSEAGDGGSFKSPMWTAAAQEMMKFPTKGPNKTTTACSSNYGHVCTLSGLNCQFTEHCSALHLVQHDYHFERAFWAGVYIYNWVRDEYLCGRAVSMDWLYHSVSHHLLLIIIFRIWWTLIATSCICPLCIQGFCIVWPHDSPHAHPHEGQ